jgi:hypothetical protein
MRGCSKRCQRLQCGTPPLHFSQHAILLGLQLLQPLLHPLGHPAAILL